MSIMANLIPNITTYLIKIDKPPLEQNPFPPKLAGPAQENKPWFCFTYSMNKILGYLISLMVHVEQNLNWTSKRRLNRWIEARSRILWYYTQSPVTWSRVGSPVDVRTLGSNAEKEIGTMHIMHTRYRRLCGVGNHRPAIDRSHHAPTSASSTTPARDVSLRGTCPVESPTAIIHLNTYGGRLGAINFYW